MKALVLSVEHRRLIEAARVGDLLSDYAFLEDDPQNTLVEIEHKGKTVKVIRFFYHFPDDAVYLGFVDGILRQSDGHEDMIRWLGNMAHEELET